MPASRDVRRHAAALLGYVCVAVVFLWPVPLHLSTALPGPVGGDTGVYVWNLWVFRHEIVEHGRYPFFTLEILSASPRVPLTLHNYTTFANLAAFPLLPLLGTIATFNALMIASGVLAAYTMFVFLRRVVGDTAAAWIGGLAFGFSPFMSARAMEHFSLVQAAPLPVFALLVERLKSQSALPLAIAAGVVVAWAFLSDPYYAVYCLVIAGFAVAYGLVSIERAPAGRRVLGLRATLDIALVCLAGLIAGIIIRGGGRVEILGLSVSVRHLYTPVMAFTAIALARLWLAVRPRIVWTLPSLPGITPHMRVAAAAGVACIVALSPVLSAMGPRFGQREWISPGVMWRSSAPGVDLLAFFVPSPLHPWWGGLFRRGIETLPNGFVENVASIPWVAIGLLVLAAALARTRLPRYWLVFTAFFALLALGPFVTFAGVRTYVPTPWALLRYAPVIGAARMPTRFSVMVMFGIAVLLAFALRDLRARWRRPAAWTTLAGALLFLELMPAPRVLHSGEVPSFYRIVAADPRPVSLLNLPFGLRDGLSSHGNFSAASQFFQTVHQKPLVGGYMSRLPQGHVARYRRIRLMRVLFDLSEGKELSEERLARAALTAPETLKHLNVGYVVINRSRAPEQLVEFARSAMGLTLVATDGSRDLYTTSLAGVSRP
jgi:hypothetical protein